MVAPLVRQEYRSRQWYHRLRGMVTGTGNVLLLGCVGWGLLFPLLGGSEYGKTILSEWGSRSFLHDNKGAVPILMLTFPLLIAGSIAMVGTATLVLLTPRNVPTTTLHQQQQQWTTGKTVPFWRRVQRSVLPPDESSTMYLVVLLIVPVCIYIAASMRRKLLGHLQSMTVDAILMKSGNIFGMVAVVALSWTLLFVIGRTTMTNPIGHFVQWDPIKMLRYHVWTGWIILLASVVHGIEHTIRFVLQGSLEMFLPPRGCWTHPHTYDEQFQAEHCNNTTTKNATATERDCTVSCYDQFLFLTGLTALLGVIGIGITSRHQIRRTNYTLFLVFHYILAPVTFLMMCIHYNKTIVYASGSFLYYLAAKCPGWIETFLIRRSRSKQQQQRLLFCNSSNNTNNNNNNHGNSTVQIISIEQLKSDTSSSQQRSCYSVTFASTKATMEAYVPGCYVYLSVPELSRIAHPFTLNKVYTTSSTNQQHTTPQYHVRIILRVHGSFTKKLEQLFLQIPSKNGKQTVVESSRTSCKGESNCYYDCCHDNHDDVDHNDGNDIGNGNYDYNNTGRIITQSSTTFSTQAKGTDTGRNLPPRMYLNGYYGSGQRWLDRILHRQYDVCIIIAAGIGITPYLSLIAMIRTISTSSSNSSGTSTDGLMTVEQRQHHLSSSNNEGCNPKRKRKRIILHWICRDLSLINYCCKEYLENNSNAITNNNDDNHDEDDSAARIEINIYHTGTTSREEINKERNEEIPVSCNSTATNADTDDSMIPKLYFSTTCTTNNNNNNNINNKNNNTDEERGIPFGLSKFSLQRDEESMFCCSKLLIVVTYLILAWGGLWVLWVWYKKQKKEQYVQRIYTPLIVAAYGLIVAVIVNVLFSYMMMYSTKNRQQRKRNNSYTFSALSSSSVNSHNVGVINSDYDIESTETLSVELTNYKNTTTNDNSQPCGQTLPMNPMNLPAPAAAAAAAATTMTKNNVHETGTIKMFQGRPDITERILADLHHTDENGTVSSINSNPAIFCCVPTSLEHTIRDGVKKFHTQHIPVYNESFEM